MTIEGLKDHIAQLREWADGNRLGGGMGSGLHAEKWPSLTPGARSTLAEHVTWLEQSLADLEAAQQWRPMETAPKERDAQTRRFPRVMLATDDGDVLLGRWSTSEYGHWYAGGRSLFESEIVGWLPLPEPPKETA